VVAGDLRVVAELAVVSVGGTADKELAFELDLLASRVACDYAQ
jgi:hypothetical protein